MIAEGFTYPRDSSHDNSATAELSWLLSRGYVNPSAVKLVGDRHGLRDRQRVAVRRAACSDEALARRAAGRVELPDLAGRPVVVDGFNVVVTAEAALGGGVLLKCRDGCVRDMASMHGNYRRVAETKPALRLIRDVLDDANAGPVRWLLDRPVSNSGRLAGLIRDAAGGREWVAECVPDPDPLLAAAGEDGDDGAVAATADAGVLDRCGPWCDLAAAAAGRVPGARAVDLADQSQPEASARAAAARGAGVVGRRGTRVPAAPAALADASGYDPADPAS